MYAAAIADHFGARLTLLAVDDPLLVEAAVSVGLVPSLSEETMQELRRVGADTAVPVLITPIERLRGRSLDEIARHVSRILAPVDLSEASPHQLTVGAGIAQALSVTSSHRSRRRTNGHTGARSPRHVRSQRGAAYKR
jgi:nucleotide-binding universal stress UspA family protein